MNAKRRLTRDGIIYSDPIDDDPNYHLADFRDHVSRVKKLFKPIQPSNLEYEIIRAKEVNRQARALLGFE